MSVVSAGLDSIRSDCVIRQRNDVMQPVSSGSVVKVHRTCRRKFCDNRGLKNCGVAIVMTLQPVKHSWPCIC